MTKKELPRKKKQVASPHNATDTPLRFRLVVEKSSETVETVGTLFKSFFNVLSPDVIFF